MNPDLLAELRRLFMPSAPADVTATPAPPRQMTIGPRTGARMPLPEPGMLAAIQRSAQPSPDTPGGMLNEMFNPVRAGAQARELSGKAAGAMRRGEMGRAAGLGALAAMAVPGVPGPDDAARVTKNWRSIMEQEPELGWWGSHGGSKAITGAAAKEMGLDPSVWRYVDDSGATRLARILLRDIANPENVSNAPLFHGRETPVGVTFERGQRIQLPTTATSSDPGYAVSYGVRGPTDPTLAVGGWDLQKTVPTLFEFAPGTNLTPYHLSYPGARREFIDAYKRDIGDFNEAIVAGDFIVDDVSRQRGLSNAWWDPEVQKVRLRLDRLFNPDTRDWTKPTERTIP